MKYLAAILITLSALWAPLIAHACTFDTDCELGSQCVKTQEAINGACVGGMFPGNSNDSEPAYNPGDANGTYGNTCSFDSDCGMGTTCVKEGGVFGACM